MFEVEALSIADAYEWLGTGDAASEYLGCHQTTVSRTVRQIRNAKSQLAKVGAEQLIKAERKIHQELRFRQGDHLRLHLYHWTNHLIHREIPPNWKANPLRISATKAHGIYLLENHFIDALCAPYPLIANPSKTPLFAAIPLYTTFLQVLTNKNAAINKERNPSNSDIACLTRLGKLDIVPYEASACSEKLDADIFNTNHQPGRSIKPEKRYWGTPLTPIASRALKPICHKQFGPYAEYLVVLKDWESHPCVEKLRESITMEIRFAISAKPASEHIKINM